MTRAGSGTCVQSAPAGRSDEAARAASASGSALTSAVTARPMLPANEATSAASSTVSQ
jgi:hypothetical protein